MTQTDGEKELVLGNKQLISLFFVVVALCGVFFAMGYMIGHNTSRAFVGTAESGTAITATTIPPKHESEPLRETAAAEVQSADNPSQPDPQPAVAPVTPAQTLPAREIAAPLGTTAVPEAGETYLQVTALRRADADNLVKTLREQKFPTLLADSSRPDLFRVLVGPYHQTADVADAKARLKSLGFASAFVQR